jgi:hypothetical protein
MIIRVEKWTSCPLAAIESVAKRLSGDFDASGKAHQRSPPSVGIAWFRTAEIRLKV